MTEQLSPSARTAVDTVAIYSMLSILIARLNQITPGLAKDLDAEFDRFAAILYPQGGDAAQTQALERMLETKAGMLKLAFTDSSTSSG